MKVVKTLFLYCLISSLLGANFDLLSTYNNHSINDTHFEKIIGIMVEFQYEETNDPNTTGRGNFLENLDIDLINGSGVRCDGFIVDPPPHNSSYFRDQIIAVSNYYNYTSGGYIDIRESDIYVASDSQVIELSNEMRYYSSSDTTIAELFAESLEEFSKLVEDIPSLVSETSYDNILFVVFHAGTGQDISFPYFDPTNYDIPSAYIDEDMLLPLFNSEDESFWIEDNEILRGIILPETLNHIQYDIIEDLFYGAENFCGYQIGITGLFALLMGYALELPLLFNTELPPDPDSGKPGVGVFGLMDYGSNNGYGVIPSPLNPWSKIMKGWDSSTNLGLPENPELIEISTNSIKRIDIANGEYFLIENRNNWISDDPASIFYEVDLDSLRNKHFFIEESSGDTIPGHFFDIITKQLGNQIMISDKTNVILGFDKYDYGLPGSGILIWSINESLINIESLQSGINNDSDNKAIQIKEADGGNDIGNTCYHWNPYVCDILTKGWGYDLWYDGNSEYFNNNPDFDVLTLNNHSNPNTKSNLGANTFIELNNFTEISSSMSFEYSINDWGEIEYISDIIDEEIEIKGSGVINSKGCIFYKKEVGNDCGYIKCFNENEESFFPDGEIECNSDYKILIPNSNSTSTISPIVVPINSYIDYDEVGDFTIADNLDKLNIYGYISSADGQLEESEYGLALGDLDTDGLDEIVLFDGETLDIKNVNLTSINNFPINLNLNEDSFDGVILIADILEDIKPEIILRVDNTINIITSNGEIVHRLASNNTNKLRLVPWGENIALIDGNRLFLFPYNMDYTYWTSQYGTDWDYPEVNPNSSHQTPSNFSNQIRFYNYPNPVVDGSTTFRFFSINENLDPKIRIFDIEGTLIETIESEGMVFQNNEFNEIQVQLKNYNTGVYFAELKDGDKSLSIIKVAVIK